ncbi:MAG: hypothetical protein ACRC0G_04615 [Fusobacteriaceae bacterium]
MENILKDLKNELSYKIRLEAFEKIKDYDFTDENNRELKNIIVNIALNDRVFAVKREAFLICQKNKITKNGEVINLGKKNTGYSPNDVRKMFIKVKRESNMTELNMDSFKEKFMEIAPKMYDVMESEHQSFDNWIRGIYKFISNR